MLSWLALFFEITECGTKSRVDPSAGTGWTKVKVYGDFRDLYSSIIVELTATNFVNYKNWGQP